MEKIFEIYINTTPSGSGRRSPTRRSDQYNFGVASSRLDVGSRIEMDRPSPGLLGEGEVLEVDPPRQLVHTMAALWGDDVKAEGASG